MVGEKPRRPLDEPEISSLALAPKEELAHLLRGIEEASKHARSILFALTTASAFVVIAALSATSGQPIKLPIAGNEVPLDQFFFWSPLVILTVFLYLQIYVQEIIGRFDRLYEFEARTLVAPSLPRDLLFPWFFVIALESRRQLRTPISYGGAFPGSDEFARVAPIPSPAISYLYPLAAMVVWFLGPFVLGILLFDYLREEKSVAIVPCIAVLVASTVAVRFVRPARSSLESGGWIVMGAGLFMFTLASVPALRERTYLAALWELRYAAGRWAREIGASAVGRELALALPIGVGVFAGRLVYLQLTPIGVYRKRIAAALNAAEGTGVSLGESYSSLRSIE